MSWDTRVSGEIKIVPPLTYAEFRDSEFRSHRNGPTLMLAEVVDSVDTPTGVNHNVTATGVVFRFAEAGKHYGVQEELTKIVQRFPEHEYTGELVLIGPEPEAGGIVRYRVVGRDVVEDKAELTWPDGSKVEF